MRITRRRFLGALGVIMFGATKPALPQTGKPEHPQAQLLVDFHVHLFGVGDGNSGCRFSETQRKHWNYRLLLNLLQLSENGRMDQDYVERLVTQLRASSVRKAVLQAWDCRYDAKGQPDWKNTTSLYVPNDYLFRIVAKYPDLFIPCASINPKRADWKTELDRCADSGARVVKIHPPTMDVNPSEERFRAFYRRCAERKLLLMFHTGAEYSADIVHTDVCDPAHLEPALKEGCIVVAAHAGTAAFFDDRKFAGSFQNLKGLIRQYPSLYFDTSVLASMFRWRVLPRILASKELISRAIHASDFPFPSNALVHWNRLAPGRLMALLGERNLIERDYRLKRAIGLPEEVFTRGAKLLELA